jgi:hypothetical protein
LAINDSISASGRSLFSLMVMRLAVAAHGADPHADTVHRDRVGGTQDLVGLLEPFQLFAALAILNLAVDPGQHVAGQREAELLGGHGTVRAGFQ